MIGKIIVTILVLSMLLFSLGVVYNNIPGATVELIATNVTPEPIGLINYESVPVFSDNLRFDHNIISYFIEDNCAVPRREAMVSAFALFAKEMKIISFYEVTKNSGADIDVDCSDNYIHLGGGLFAAGEGGPSIIINTSTFKIIEKGKILLYDDPHCSTPVVELHELCHVFGFDHSTNPKNIMYNISSCDQKISNDMIELINSLYSVRPLADLSLTDVVAIKRGKYLDFNITISNEGIISANDTDLTIVADSEVIKVVKIGKIDIGYSQTLRVTNIRLPSRNSKVINFIVDKNNNVIELNEDNNVVELISNF